MFLVIVLGNKKDVCYVCLCVVLVPVCYAPKEALRTHCANQPKPTLYKLRFLLFKLKIHCSITEIPETLLNSLCSHTYTIMIIYGFYISAI